MSYKHVLFVCYIIVNTLHKSKDDDDGDNNNNNNNYYYYYSNKLPLHQRTKEILTSEKNGKLRSDTRL